MLRKCEMESQDVPNLWHSWIKIWGNQTEKWEGCQRKSYLFCLIQVESNYFVILIRRKLCKLTACFIFHKWSNKALPIARRLEEILITSGYRTSEIKEHARPLLAGCSITFTLLLIQEKRFLGLSVKCFHKQKHRTRSWQTLSIHGMSPGGILLLIFILCTIS